MRMKHWQVSACAAVMLSSSMQVPAQQTGLSAQQVGPTSPATPQAVQNDTTGTSGLPQAPAPRAIGPLFLRPTAKDYSKGKSGFPNPLRWYTPTAYPAPRLSNTPRLDDLIARGKDLPEPK